MILSCTGFTRTLTWILGTRYKYKPNMRKVINKTINVTPVASTGKVLYVRDFPSVGIIKNEDDIDSQSTIVSGENRKYIYGKPLSKPILGKHFKITPHAKYHTKPIFDKTLPYIPVYSHLNIYDVQYIERPPTPEHLIRVKHVDLVEGGKSSLPESTEKVEKSGKLFKINIK